MAKDVAQRDLDQAGFRISNLGTPTTAGDATKTDNTSVPKAASGAGSPGTSLLAAAADHGVAAAGAIATGPIIIATEGESPSRRDRVLTLTIPAAGAILGYIASGLFARAKDHGTLAAQASLALNQPSPADEVIACNAALAAWNTARSEASQPLMSLVTANRVGSKGDTGTKLSP